MLNAKQTYYSTMIFKLDDKTPEISDSCYVAPGASLIGEVVLKDQASVWFNCVIRADNARIEVGKNSNVQDGSVLHVDEGYPLTIGQDVTIGHKVMLHGCTIGDGSLVGINAVVLNGANIGKGCLIAANSLVTENMEIPDGSMVMGSPAKVVKQLSEKELALLKKGAEHYIENSRRYKSKLI